MVGDCYFLAGIEATSEYPTRIKYNIITKNQTTAGLFALNVWVRGIPIQLVVDDFIPFYYSTTPAFA